jgi:hypothetical protein
VKSFLRQIDKKKSAGNNKGVRWSFDQSELEYGRQQLRGKLNVQLSHDANFS